MIQNILVRSVLFCLYYIYIPAPTVELFCLSVGPNSRFFGHKQEDLFSESKKEFSFFLSRVRKRKGLVLLSILTPSSVWTLKRKKNSSSFMVWKYPFRFSSKGKKNKKNIFPPNSFLIQSLFKSNLTLQDYYSLSLSLFILVSKNGKSMILVQSIFGVDEVFVCLFVFSVYRRSTMRLGFCLD